MREKDSGWLKVLAAVPAIALLLAWENVGRGDATVAFFFSYPSQVLADLWTGMVRDRLWLDCLYTLLPCIVGLALGALIGGGAGFGIISVPVLARNVQVYVSALGAFPVFAIAPMTLVWFGLGFDGKIFLAFLSCVFVFLQACYSGGMAVPDRLVAHFRVHGFGAREEFAKLRLPFAVDWIAASFKMSANLALLGVFVGEFIASERGLGRVMLNAGGLYNVKRVLAAGVCFALLALALIALADAVYKRRRSIIRSLSVPAWVRLYPRSS